MCRRHREQAQLPQFSGVIMKFELHPGSLWELSLLAIAVGQLARMLNVPSPSRASSAPTVFRGDHEIRATPWIPCGSELARDSGGQIAPRLDAASATMAARTLGRAAIRAMNDASAGQSLIWILNNGSQFKTVNK